VFFIPLQATNEIPRLTAMIFIDWVHLVSGNVQHRISVAISKTSARKIMLTCKYANVDI